MSNDFEKEAENILKNAPEPDADAATIREGDNASAPAARKRGRPPGSGTSKKTSKSTSYNKVSNPAEFEAAAKAANTIIFSATCAFTGSDEAWPSDEKAAVMDKSLARYMEIKNYVAPPEVALIAAYAAYIGEVSAKPVIRENVAKRFGGFKGKFAFISTFINKFKKNKNATTLSLKKGN